MAIAGKSSYVDSGIDSDDNEEEIEEEEIPAAGIGADNNSTASTTAGKVIGVALSTVRDSKIRRYDVVVNGFSRVYIEVINNQDNIGGKSKKFFNLLPNPTEQLYGYVHSHALLNTRSKCGWLGHCRLKTTKLESEGDGYLLWEIWETRCVSPRIDGIVFNKDGICMKLQNIEKWLVENELSSDLDGEFDDQYHHE